MLDFTGLKSLKTRNITLPASFEPVHCHPCCTNYFSRGCSLSSSAFSSISRGPTLWLTWILCPCCNIACPHPMSFLRKHCWISSTFQRLLVFGHIQSSLLIFAIHHSSKRCLPSFFFSSSIVMGQVCLSYHWCYILVKYLFLPFFFIVNIRPHIFFQPAEFHSVKLLCWLSWKDSLVHMHIQLQILI